MDILSIILQSLLILDFLMAALSKIIGSKTQVEAFEHLELPHWFRVVTGLQLAGRGWATVVFFINM